MIYNKSYFVKGEVEGNLVITERNYFGEVADVRSFVGDNEGLFVLTLAWEVGGRSGRKSLSFTKFSDAIKASNGYWARQSIWHITAEGRKRVIRWA